MKKKNKLHKIITALVVALAIVLVLPTASADAAGAKMNKKSVTVCTGKSYTLKMSGISKKVKWSTSDKKVVSISKKSGKKSEKCTIKGKKNGTATITAKVKVGKKTKTFRCKVTVKGHAYDEAIYTWNKNMTKCTASKECKRCHRTLKQTVKTTKKTIKKATCTAKGNVKYTAKFTKYDFGTKTKKVTLKKLGHVCSKPTYTWSGNYSSCTAKATCKRCDKGFSEKVKATSVVTTPATKTSTGVMTYTAKFKTKGFTTQTKNVTIPKIAYLDKNSVTIRSNRPATVTLYNDSIKEVSGSLILQNFTIDKPYDKEPIHHNIEYQWDDTTITISTNDKLGVVRGDIKIDTKSGKTLVCHIDTEFTPGTEYVGSVVLQMYSRNESPYYYCAYGDLKGTWTNGAYQYRVKCQTREEYDAAKYFYENQTDSNGNKVDLAAKVNDIDSQCYVRRDYCSVADKEWENLSESDKENLYNNNINTYYLTKYGDAGYNYVMLIGDFVFNNFPETISSDAQVKKIVDDWKAVSGEMPSWYYPTVFSDWAEWSGHDYVE